MYCGIYVYYIYVYYIYVIISTFIISTFIICMIHVNVYLLACSPLF